MDARDPLASNGGRVSGNRSNDAVVSRRAALRRLGFTTGAGMLGMFAADDAVRMVLAGLEQHRETKAIASVLANDFRAAGIAYAQVPGYHCGVQGVLCQACPDDSWGNPIPPCPCDPYSAGCIGCNPPTSCTDCMTVADYRFCCCQQAAVNAYPACADCVGYPLGDPTCIAYNSAIIACSLQYRNDTANC